MASKAPTKFGRTHNLNLPGGTNAKEILVQMPTVGPMSLSKKTLADKFDAALFHGAPARSGGGYASYADVLTRCKSWEIIVSGTGTLHKFSIYLTYTGGHFSEPNILVHIRTNERDVGGKKTLHGEEFQSDWHQQGTEEGLSNSWV